MNKNQIVVLGGITLIVIAIVAGYKSVNKIPNGEAETAQKNAAVASAWDNLVSAGSIRMTTTLDLALPNSAAQAANQPVVDIAIKTEGDSIWREKPTYTGNFTLTTKGRGMQLFTDGDIYILPDSVIFKLHNLPTLLNPSGNLLGKWTSVQAPLLKTTNPEEVIPMLKGVFTNWSEMGQDNGLVRYEKSFSPDEEKQIERFAQKTASGNEALHIIARLVRSFDIDKAEAWVTTDGKELKQLTFHFKNSSKEDQQATLHIAFSGQGKEVSIHAPQAETSVKPEIFTQLFGEPKASPTPAPKASTLKKKR